MPAVRVTVGNPNHPGSTHTLDAAKYNSMKASFLATLPDAAPGRTLAEIRAALPGFLSEEHFPGGEKAGWWMKAVQLDLEAKGVVRREATKPLRLHKA
jgi:hypothetical protein